MAAQLAQFSFELFPPRTPEGAAKLPGIAAQLATVQPKYFSVTYGAGGSDQDGTYETVVRVVEKTGVDAPPHPTPMQATAAIDQFFFTRPPLSPRRTMFSGAPGPVTPDVADAFVRIGGLFLPFARESSSR